MAGDPCILVENHLSVRQFPLVTLVGNEEATGHEAFRVADGRRSPLDFWTSITTNQEATLTWTNDRVRAWNMVALDRGHNLAGIRVIHEASDDNFATTQTVFDITLPAATAPGSLDDALGVRTEEGAWLKRFPTRSAKYGRLRIPAMGVGLKPQIVGVWAGLTLTPPQLGLPHAPDQDEFTVEETVSQAGWRGRTAPVVVRVGTITLKLTDTFAYELARYHLQGHFGRGRATWIIHDDLQADRAVLALRPQGRLGLARDPGWFYPAGQVEWIEHEALVP